MKQTKISFLAIAIALVSFAWFLPSIGEAACNVKIGGFVFPTIQSAINSAGPFTTIFVTGECDESISIEANKNNLRLNGQPPGAPDRAIIRSTTPPGTPLINTNVAVSVRGATDVRILNFHITSDGTSDLVNIVDGANVRLSDSLIENGLREGVFVRAASGRIFNNTIQNNGGDGIIVTEGSAVRIGFSSTDDGFVGPNTIQNNAGNGISVSRSSAAQIRGNTTTIRGNGGHGISVFKVSHAEIASNDISGNGGDGINVTENSGVNLGSAVIAGVTNVPPVSPVFLQPNTTTEPNNGFGIRCSIGAYVRGELGTLSGDRGAKRFDKTCIDRLTGEDREKEDEED
jgi:parallel beta-helix repeat protein